MNSDVTNRPEDHRSTHGPKKEDGVALPAGTRLSEEFELERVLGEGGFSVVYLAFDHTLERRVAIKEYLPRELARRCSDGTVAPRPGERQTAFATGLRSFLDEARLLAKFEHPALVKVFRFWEANGTAYMAMPHYAGKTLREINKTDPGFATEARLKALIAPLLDAVALLHAEKCFHRDIAPDNIIVQDNGAPVLLDFGAARRIIGDMTHAVTAVLKPGYAPIEQYSEEGGPAQGPWTDVYAFAAVLYASITGKPPLAAPARAYNDTLELLQRNPPAGYSPRFLRGVDAGLAVRPEDRPQAIADFRALLGLDLEQNEERTILMPRPRSPTASSADRAQRIRKSPMQGFRRLPAIFAVIGAAVLTLFAVVYFTTLADRSPAKPLHVVAESPPAPAVARALDPREEIRAVLRSLDCGYASFELGDSGTLTVNGHLQDSRQQSELEQRLRGITGVKELRTNLAFVTRPFCEVTSLLAGLRTAEGGALEVRVAQPKLPLRVGQQPVLLDVVGASFAANVAIDVWSLAENEPARLEVAHLLPHAGYSLSDEFKMNEHRTINRITDGKSQQVIRVTPPAGRLLFTAIASDRPLVQRDRAFNEDPVQYIASLRAIAEAGGSNARIATWYGFVDVLP
jgi:serine/threonine protein kinase